MKCNKQTTFQAYFKDSKFLLVGNNTNGGMKCLKSKMQCFLAILLGTFAIKEQA